MNTPEVSAELRKIAGKHNGILRPCDVVQYAYDHPKSALHGRMEWDNKTCGTAHRLEQARDIITMEFDVMENDTMPVRMYVSLGDDRKKKGGGYRTLVSVMSDPERRAQFLEESFIEFKRWREKFAHLKELEPIFAAHDKVRGKRRARRKPGLAAGV